MDKVWKQTGPLPACKIYRDNSNLYMFNSKLHRAVLGRSHPYDDAGCLIYADPQIIEAIYPFTTNLDLDSDIDFKTFASGLSDKDQSILYMSLFSYESHSEIAESIGASRVWVSVRSKQLLSRYYKFMHKIQEEQ